jgi:tetratricopeptide (TPR) repeat protein
VRSGASIERGSIAIVALTTTLSISACRSRPAPSATSAEEAATPAAAGGYIPTPPGGPTPEWELAVKLFRQGNTLQFQDRLDEAIESYQRSLAAYPTAEAHTFLGWTYSWKGRLEDGITEAQKAVSLDPDYGNPYNDIGLYLIELGRLDEAVGWLQKAIEAKRYDERQFPHLNLGRIWTRKGMFEDAFDAFESCLRIWRNPSLPEFPSVRVRIAATSDTSPQAGLVRELKTAIDAYFQAWNTYNPTALVAASTPHPPDVTEALLQHLADAKLRRVNRVLVGLELRRFNGDVALVEADVQTEGASRQTEYVLQRHQRIWKVMGPAVVAKEPAQDAPGVEPAS